jgi:Peptidase family M23/Transglycosylase SLT domain
MRNDPMTGKPTMHKGIDIAMPTGAPVGATMPGTVVYAGFGQKGSGYGGYGNVVVVKDANGNLHQYAHLDSIGVKVGQKVGSGSVLGGAGSTGKSTGPHLDYSVKNNKGVNVNPTSYIMGTTANQTGPNKRNVQKEKVIADSFGASSMTKLSKEAAKSPTFKTFVGHLKIAVGSGAIPKEWAIELAELVGRESSWNPKAKNKNSSAHGYGQFLSPTRKDYEKKTGLSYDNPVNQLVMMAQYIKDRYGTPAKALAFWEKNKYY